MVKQSGLRGRTGIMLSGRNPLHALTQVALNHQSASPYLSYDGWIINQNFKGPLVFRSCRQPAADLRHPVLGCRPLISEDPTYVSQISDPCALLSPEGALLLRTPILALKRFTRRLCGGGV